MSFLKKSLMILGTGCLLIGFTWLMNQPSHYVDLTSHKHHQVGGDVAQLLESLSDPLTITLVSSRFEDERTVNFLVDAWKKIKPDITVKVQHDPITPEQQQEYRFFQEGIVLTCGDITRSSDLMKQPLSNALLTQLLYQVKQQSTHWVAFAYGHGEPDPLGQLPQDYGTLSQQLESNGFKIQALNLAQVGFIPDNTSLLILTSPKNDYLPKEEQLIEAYLKQGGDVLWMMDFQGKPLPFLSHLLGVNALKGIIIDKHGHSMGTPHPAITLITSYQGPLKSMGEQISAFPWAQALNMQPKAAFKTKPLLNTHADTWTQKGPLEGTLRFEPEQGDIAGPLPLGVLLTRSLEGSKTEQRIIVVGNHRFATNAVIHNYGNSDLLKTMTHLLVHEDEVAQFQSTPSFDTLTLVPKWFEQGFKILFQALIPATFVFLGLWIQRKRRHGIR